MRTFGVGIIGCGNISEIYFSNTALFKRLKLVACADAHHPNAEKRAAQFGVEALSVKQLLARKDVDIVVNLTVPNAHFEVSQAALKAGKHVFTEKPLSHTAAKGRALVKLAAEKGLHLASAPDTFLGAGGQLARGLIADGKIGKPVAGTAFLMAHGPESWHPSPDFFYQPGGGPVLDMGPYYITALVNLLGPVAKVTALTAIGNEFRTISAEGPRKGEKIVPTTPTTAMAILEFAAGANVVATFSWDVWKHGCAPIEIHGTLGSLRIPDPNFYGGDVEISESGADWRAIGTTDETFGKVNWPAAAPKFANFRVIGIADMAAAIERGAPARASGDLALHVLDVLEAILVSGDKKKAIVLTKRDVSPPRLDDAQGKDLAK